MTEIMKLLEESIMQIYGKKQEYACWLDSTITCHDTKISHEVVKAKPEVMLSKDSLSVALNS